MPTYKFKITRLKAFAIHIGISLTIFLFLMILLLGYWYKTPFFDLEDGPRAVQIIIFVDLVLGPLLTLIVFKPGKPNLKLDMSLIALFQLSALIYGVWMVQVARPVAVLLTRDALYIASYRSIKESTIPKAGIDKIIQLEPTYLYIDLPKDHPNFAALVTKASQESRMLELFYKHAEPLSFSNKKQISTIAIDMEKYAALNGEWFAKFQSFMSTNKRSLETTTFLPIIARSGKYFLVVDHVSGEVIDYLDVPYDENLGLETRMVNKD